MSTSFYNLLRSCRSYFQNFLNILPRNAHKTNSRVVCTIALIAIFVTTIQQFPNYFAFLKTPPGYFYSGQASWFDPWDINVYVSAIRYGQENKLLLKNLYSTEDTTSALIYPLYTAVGHTFTANPYLLFHALASIAGIVLVIVLYQFSFALFRSQKYAVLATLCTAIGGGFGWIVDGVFPSADIYVTSFTFASSFQRGHEAVGIVLYISAMLLYYFSLQKYSFSLAIFSLLSLLSLTFFYPYYGLIFAVVCGVSTVLHIRESKKYLPFIYVQLGIICIAGIASLLYFFHLHSSGFAAAASEQLKPVSLLQLLLGYGPFLLVGIATFFFKKETLPKYVRFLLIWLIVAVALSFLPLGFARFFLRGLFFPLSLLVLTLLQQLTFKAVAQMLLITLLVMMPLSRLYVFYKRVHETVKNNAWYYFAEGASDAFSYIADRKKDGVLTFYRYGNIIPAQTGKQVFFGHLLQTPGADEKISQITQFYSGAMSEEDAKTFLTQNAISFVVYGKDEVQIGGHVYEFMQIQFENNAVKIYSY